jgi:pantetheine-phosphate adenylyltransferase
MRIAIYAGTFDPITRGHLSVIERAAQLFDRLVVVVAVNPDKHPLFSGEERRTMIEEVTRPWPNVACDTTSGYVVHFAQAQGARYLVRGVRSSTEVDAEIDLANANRVLAPGIETIFVPAHPALSEVSSSRLKALAASGEEVSRYCSPEVEARLRARLGRREVAHV